MQKFMKYALAAMMVVFTFSSCNNEETAPKETASKFLDAVSSGKMDEAKKYCTERYARILDIMNPNKETPEKFDIVETRINGDSARVILKGKTTQSLKKLDLIKIDNTWKVDIKPAVVPDEAPAKRDV